MITTSSKSPKSNNQSLIDLIHSSFFRDFYIVSYLFEKIDQEQIVRELLAKFTTYSYSNCQEFIPFLVFIATKYKNEKIKDWMCAQSQLNDIRLYLVIRWAFMSVEGSSNETFINLIDSYAVNGKLMCKMDDMSKEEIQSLVQKKFQRSSYIPILVELYHKLTKICLKLKGYLNSERNAKLKHYLHAYLKSFHDKLHNNCPNALQGFTFPHSSQSNYVVNLNFDECLCFSTKERVPYKLVFETINYEQLISLEQKQEKGSGSTSDLQSKTQSSDEEEQRDDLINLVTQERETAIKMQCYLEQKKKKRSQVEANEINQISKLGGYTSEQDWQQQVRRIKKASKFSHFKSLQVRAYIVKSGDDLRQEAFAMQLIKMVKNIFSEFNLKIWVRTYDIIMTSATSGFIEFIPNTITVSTLKKTKLKSLDAIFLQMFGDHEEVACLNFAISLAGYCILQYLFLIKDRHNGNIMLDSQGHIIHIDFGFLLGSSPGNMGFQTAPFKLPYQYIDIMGGVNSELFKYFKQLLFTGFSHIKRYAPDIIKFIKVTKQIVNIRCLDYYKPADLQKRFMIGLTDAELRKSIDKLIYDSLGSRMTHVYDQFQYKTNGIYY